MLVGNPPSLRLGYLRKPQAARSGYSKGQHLKISTPPRQQRKPIVNRLEIFNLQALQIPLRRFDAAVAEDL